MPFRKEGGRNTYFLLLIGMIFRTLLSSLSTLMQVLIDPNEYQIVQNKMFASFNNIKTDLLLIVAILMLITTLYFLRFAKYLDVMLLGSTQAINLGVDYDYVMKRILIVVAILTSVSTALVGPTTFLRLMVAIVASQFTKSYKRKHAIPASIFYFLVSFS